MRFASFVFFAFLSCFISPAQPFREQVYQSYITGNLDAWEQILKENHDRQMSQADQYEFAMAHYGFIGLCVKRDQKSRARPYLDHVELIANNLMAGFPDDARYIALRGALYGFRLMYQPQKMMVLGPKALKRVNQALEKDPECPHAWVETGNKDYFMPEVFGGSKTRALADYEKAIRLMEKDAAMIRHNWFYLNAHMVLASWYEESGRTFAARELCRKILLVEPDFAWARERIR